MMEQQLLVSSPASLRKLVKVEKVRTNTLAATTKGKNWKIFFFGSLYLDLRVGLLE